MLQHHMPGEKRDLLEDGRPVRLRILPSTSKRCSVVFVSGAGAEAVIKNLFNDERIIPVNETPGGLFLRAAPLPSWIEEYERQQGKGTFTYREKLGLTEECIVVPEIPFEASKSEKIQWGSIVRHEYMHSRGGYEYKAYRAGDEYLERNNFSSRFVKEEDLFSFLSEHPMYGEGPEFAAKIESVLHECGDANNSPLPNESLLSLALKRICSLWAEYRERRSLARLN